MDRGSLIERLRAAGCVAAEDEADELLAGNVDLETALARREAGEPLAWIVGSAPFCDLQVKIDTGVYVPRWQSEPMVRAAAAHLPPDGTALDLCTGSGAVAMVLKRHRPRANIFGTDLDAAAVACARRNGVHALVGSLFEPLPKSLRQGVDVLVAVAPYVPTGSMKFLPTDVRNHEPRVALDGGASGTSVVEAIIREAPRWLAPAGHLFLEVGGDQAARLEASMRANGFEHYEVHYDEDGDVRFVHARIA